MKRKYFDPFIRYHVEQDDDGDKFILWEGGRITEGYKKFYLSNGTLMGVTTIGVLGNPDVAIPVTIFHAE